MGHYTCASDQAIVSAASALAESRLVLVEGPFGSGRSFAAAAVARGWDGEAGRNAGGRCPFDTVYRVYGERTDAGTEYGAVEHLLGADCTLDKWSQFSARLAGAGRTLIVVDDAQFLDGHSLTLLEWALRMPEVQMLATVPSIEDSSAATELAAQTQPARITLGPVGPQTAHRMLAEWWQRDPQAREVAWAQRLSGGLPGMLLMFADFAAENALDATDPATWERRLLDSGSLSFGRLGERIGRLRAVHEPDTWTALTTVAVAGALDVDVAVRLLGVRSLGNLRKAGLLRVDARLGAVMPASGILDLGLRGSLSAEAVAALWEDVLQPLIDSRAWLPPASRVAWLDAQGIAGIRTRRGPAAAAALREGSPEVALRLVAGARDGAALLTAAEAHWHAGRLREAAEAVEEALASPPDYPLGTREVVAAVLTGRYRPHQSRLGKLPGAETLSRIVSAAYDGGHASVIRLAGDLPADAPEEFRLLATSLAAMSHARLGSMGAAVRAVRSLGDQPFFGETTGGTEAGMDRCSFMTGLLMNDARHCVALLAGEWGSLTADLDRTAQFAGPAGGGTGDVLAVLLGRTEAEVAGSGWAGTVPAVARELRHLAIAVRKYDADPSAALERVRRFRSRSMPADRESINGVDVLAAAWELKLCAVCGSQPDLKALFSAEGTGYQDAGVLRRILGMVAAALEGGGTVTSAGTFGAAGRNRTERAGGGAVDVAAGGPEIELPAVRSSVLQSAAALAELHGLDQWLPPLRNLVPQAPQHPRHALSLRELQICQMASEGHTSSEIAERLGISVRTVEKHLGNAYRKLGVSARGQLAELGAGWSGSGSGELS